MWINNYDDALDMDFDTAIRLLSHNGYKDVTEKANVRINTRIFRIYQHPRGKDAGEYYCTDEDDVIELAIGEGLSFE